MALQVALPRKASVLSAASLSLDANDPINVKFDTVYRRNDVKVKRLKYARTDRNTKYPVCVLPPRMGWYPSTTANFIMGFDDRNPEWFLELVPRTYNPSLWLSTRHNDAFVLRVPKDRQEETRKKLYERNLWFHGAKNLWFRRKRHR